MPDQSARRPRWISRRLARPLRQAAADDEAGIDAAFGVPEGRDGSWRGGPGLYGRVEAIERAAPAEKGEPGQITVVVTSEYPLEPGDLVSFEGRVVGAIDTSLDVDGVWPGIDVTAVVYRDGPAAAEIVHARFHWPILAGDEPTRRF